MWPSGKAGACKALIPGSIPGIASISGSIFRISGAFVTQDLKAVSFLNHSLIQKISTGAQT